MKESLKAISLAHVHPLRYGENQRLGAQVLRLRGAEPSLPYASFTLGHNREAETKISLTDLDRGLRTTATIAAAFEKNFGAVPHIAVGVKHGNACGAAVAETPEKALVGMIEGDDRAIFGGLVVTTFSINGPLANMLRHYYRGQGTRLPRPIMALAAPAIDEEARTVLARKSRPVLIFEQPRLAEAGFRILPKDPGYRHLPMLGLMVKEEPDSYVIDLASDDIRVEGDYGRFAQSKPDMALAWAVAATSSSNTITVAKGGRIVANAVGGQDRVGACLNAMNRLVRERGVGSGLVAASDSFFPFADGPKVLQQGGVDVLLATYGSQNDRLVAERCRERGMTLVWIDDKLGRGFYGH